MPLSKIFFFKIFQKPPCGYIVTLTEKAVKLYLIIASSVYSYINYKQKERDFSLDKLLD